MMAVQEFRVHYATLVTRGVRRVRAKTEVEALDEVQKWVHSTSPLPLFAGHYEVLTDKDPRWGTP